MRPATWQGWAISAVAVGLIATGLGVWGRSGKGTVIVVAVALAYVAISYATGDPHRLASDASDSAPASDAGVSEARISAARSRAADAPAPSPTREVRPLGPTVIEVDHLTKEFGERVAFSDVSFTVHQGEVFGFLGPNGAGKTTTVRTLSTLITATSGTAVVAGIPLTEENGVEIRQRIAVMTELPGLYARLSVEENLEFFAGLYGITNTAARITSALEAVNLADRASDTCGSLSKGLRQRVGLARVLLNDPEIIFLDEPTSGLDPVATLEVIELIETLRRRGVTTFLTTHRLEEAERLCDRVAILNTTLRTVGRTDELRQGLFQRSLLVTTVAPLAGAEQLFATVSGVESWQVADGSTYTLTVSDPAVVAPQLTRALVAAGADVLSIAESRHSLEDVYLELVGAATGGDAR